MTIKAKGGASGRLHGKVTGKEVADAWLSWRRTHRQEEDRDGDQDIKDAGVFNGKVRCTLVWSLLQDQVEVEQA